VKVTIIISWMTSVLKSFRRNKILEEKKIRVVESCLKGLSHR